MSRKSKAAEFASDLYKVHVTGRHVLVTDAMKQYAVDRINRIEKFGPDIIDVDITMDIQKLEHRVDITMKVGHIRIKAKSATNDMYASVDMAIKKIERQLVKHRKWIKEHHAKPLYIEDLKVHVLRQQKPDDIDVVNDAIEEAIEEDLLDKYRPHEIVSNETMPLKTLTLDEAVRKMDLSGDSFMLFRAIEDQKVRLIYRREDEEYGLIEPTM